MISRHPKLLFMRKSAFFKFVSGLALCLLNQSEQGSGWPVAKLLNEFIGCRLFARNERLNWRSTLRYGIWLPVYHKNKNLTTQFLLWLLVVNFQRRTPKSKMEIFVQIFDLSWKPLAFAANPSQILQRSQIRL